MPAKALQSYGVSDKNSYTKYWVHFNAKIGDINFFDIVKTPIIIKAGDIPVLHQMFKNIIENLKNCDITSNLRARAAFLNILSWYFEHISLDDITIEESPVEKLNAVVAFMENNLDKEISIEEMAEIVHFHPNYFIKFFRNHMDCSPVQYVNRLKVEKAKQLLKSTNLSIRNIAEKTGFNEAGYFSRTFKKYTGHTPREFRKQGNMIEA